MRKIIAILTACAVILLPSATFAQKLTVSTTEDEITLNVDFGEEFAGREVAVELIRPSKSYFDATDDSELTIFSVFEYLGQDTADGEGKVTFVITPRADAPAGYYDAAASVKGITIKPDNKFAYAPRGAVEELILSLEAAEATVSTIADVFRVPEDAEELAGYEILGFGELDEYSIYAGKDYGTEEMKNVVHTLLKAELEGKTYTKAQVQNAFSSAVCLAVMYTQKDSQKLKSFMEDYPEKTGLSSASLYEQIYSKSASFSKEAKIEVAQKLTEYNWTDETIAEIAAVIDEYIFMAALTHISDGYGKIGELIDLGENLLKANGADLTKYDTSVKQSVWREVSAETTMASFISKLNSAIKANQKSGSGGGGGGGGGSSSGGSRKEANSQISTNNIAIGGNITENSALVQNSGNQVFIDIEDVAWAQEAIFEFYKKGIIQGREKNLFCPDASMTRSEFVKVLMMALSLSDSNARVNFDDVKEDDWFYPYVASAHSLGVVNGYGTYFAPYNTISREEAAVMIHRCTGITETELPVMREEVNFTDYGEIADFAGESVTALYKAGIINGMSEDEFSPKENITRAQAVKMIYGLINAI